jgi:hypothetical protein
VFKKNISDGVGSRNESIDTPLYPPLFWLDNIFKKGKRAVILGIESEKFAAAFLVLKRHFGPLPAISRVLTYIDRTLTHWFFTLSTDFPCLLSIAGPNFRGGRGKDADMCTAYNFLTHWTLLRVYVQKLEIFKIYI